MYNSIISYWAWFGTLYLIWLTYQDYKSMEIDDRKNYFMMGITISLLTHLDRGLVYILAVFLIVFVMGIAFKRFKVLGEGDINSISWIFLGFGFLNPYQLAWFSLFFIVVTVIYFSLKKYLFKVDKPAPFFYVILISYVLNSLLFAIY